MNALFNSAPDFDHPLEVLLHCHGRIRKQLNTLQKLGPHLSIEGASVSAQQAATAVLRYFDQAAPNHHADEEQDLLPMLLAAGNSDDAALLKKMTTKIADEHHQMNEIWQPLALQLRAIAAGKSVELAAAQVETFVKRYTAHIEKEEAIIVPMAQRLFDAARMQQLGDAMRSRRALPLR